MPDRPYLPTSSTTGFGGVSAGPQRSGNTPSPIPFARPADAVQALDTQPDRRVVPPDAGPPPVVPQAGLTFDEDELRRGLAALISPGSIHEIRVLPSRRSRRVQGDDPEAAIGIVAELAPGSTGVYLTINPLSSLMPPGHAAKDRDIARRMRLLVDLDPVRPGGCGATEEQRAAAWDVSVAVRADLVARGWPEPFVVDSGNGIQMHYAMDLPNDEGATRLVRGVLRALAARHDTAAVKVDVSVHNASRIARLPGTVNRKGDGLGDRPHRLCRVVSAPTPFEEVTCEQLEAMAAEAPSGGRGATPGIAVSTSAGEPGRGAIHATARERGYGLAALADENRRMREAPPGERHAALYRAAASLGELVAGGSLAEAEVRLALRLGAEECGLRNDDGADDVDRTIGDGLARGAESPRGGPPRGSGQADTSGDVPRPSFSNVRAARSGAGEGSYRVPIDQPELVAGLKRLTGGWPKQVAGRLFARDAAHGAILPLNDPEALFAWIGQHARITWARGAAVVPQKRFFEALRLGVEAFDAIEHVPHFPPAPQVYYTCVPPVAAGDGTALDGLVGLFNPLTELDRELIRSFVMTLFWGGDGGLRPLFLVEGPPDDQEGGRGVGKSTLVMLLAGLVGGYFGGISPAMPLETIARRIINDRWQKRVLLLDNVKSSRFSWADFEGLVTSRTVGGWRLHAGDEDRPNRITYAATINEARLSSDLATRAVQIRLGRPASYDTDRQEPWSEAVQCYLAEHRDRIISDVAAAFARSADRVAAGRLRWAAWCHEVLGRCPRGADARDLILARQAELNDDRAEAEAFEHFLAEKFAAHFNRPAETLVAWISTSDLAPLATEFVGEKVAPRTLARWIGLHRTPRLTKHDRSTARGWQWRGAEATEGQTPVPWNAGLRRGLG